MKLSDEEVKQAVRWFSRQRESYPFFAALQSVLEESGPLETCALHRHDERRKFAANLIAMAETEHSDGQNSDRTHDADRPKHHRKGPGRTRRAGPAGRS